MDNSETDAKKLVYQIYYARDRYQGLGLQRIKRTNQVQTATPQKPLTFRRKIGFPQRVPLRFLGLFCDYPEKLY